MAVENVADLTQLHALIGQRLLALHLRRIPVRRVATGPTRGVTRLQWGDGTILLARSRRPGSMSWVWKAVHDGETMVVEDWHEDATAVSARLVRKRGRPHHVDVVILGLDQPD